MALEFEAQQRSEPLLIRVGFSRLGLVDGREGWTRVLIRLSIGLMTPYGAIP